MAPSHPIRRPGIALAAALALGLGFQVAAQEPPPHEERQHPEMGHPPTETDPLSFDSLDRNLDGFLTRDEIPGGHPLEQQFDEADTDGDNRLSREEFEAWRQRLAT